ncbi:MAG TPA: polyphosphate kinase 2 [Mycobacteriales bacterium]|nr:polyphosphate kinase 2 [Mycobacteriales bacterium]
MSDDDATEKVPKEIYEAELQRLQVELSHLKDWVVDKGQRVLVIFEGRDAAGKGGVIARITQNLSPRVVRVVALPAPTEREKTQWYFQRYVEHLPAAGEIVIFDRSWYNRAGVEPVMGFCTKKQHKRFLEQAPVFEKMLVDDGIHLRKYWLDISEEEQERRFADRAKDPLKQWKLSPIDLASRDRWAEYQRRRDEMFKHTDSAESPWWVVESDDKRRSRLNLMSHLLESIPYTFTKTPPVKLPKRPPAKDQHHPPASVRRVPDHAAEVIRAVARKG